MSFRVCGGQVFLTLVCMSVASCFAQPAVIETLFDTLPGKGRSEKRALVLNTTASRALAKRPGSATLKNFPLAHGQSADFELSPARIFEPDAKIIAIGPNGRQEELPLGPVRGLRRGDVAGVGLVLGGELEDFPEDHLRFDHVRHVGGGQVEGRHGQGNDQGEAANGCFHGAG